MDKWESLKEVLNNRLKAHQDTFQKYQLNSEAQKFQSLGEILLLMRELEDAQPQEPKTKSEQYLEQMKEKREGETSGEQ